jgi:hypothetical protein
MTLAGKQGEPDRKLLDSVWGEVPQKNTTAIMGTFSFLFCDTLVISDGLLLSE